MGLDAAAFQAFALTLVATLAQDSDDDVSGSTALVIFLIVMAIVIGALVVIQRRRKSELEAGGSFEQRERADEEARRLSFEQKMRRVEERLRAAQGDDGDSPSEPRDDDPTLRDVSEAADEPDPPRPGPGDDSS